MYQDLPAQSTTKTVIIHLINNIVHLNLIYLNTTPTIVGSLNKYDKFHKPRAKPTITPVKAPLSKQ